jgi:hypothetical protein
MQSRPLVVSVGEEMPFSLEESLIVFGNSNHLGCFLQDYKEAIKRKRGQAQLQQGKVIGKGAGKGARLNYESNNGRKRGQAQLRIQ